MNKLFAIYACKNELGKPENEQLCSVRGNVAIFKTSREAYDKWYKNGLDLLQSVYPSKYTCPQGRLYVKEIDIW